MIKICKTILSGATPGQIRGQTDGLASAPLRELAAQLASDPGLTVSVITYDDGQQELEILHTGPPHHTEDTIDTRRFTRQSLSRGRPGRCPSSARAASTGPVQAGSVVRAAGRPGPVPGGQRPPGPGGAP